MKKNKKNVKVETEKFVLLALFTALVAILSYLGGFIKIGSLASISLTLIPVVLGAALCGPLAGAWLGAVSGAVFLLTPDAALWLGISIHGTIITVLVKGILAGLLAGVVYRLLSKFNLYIAVFVSAIVCPVINTAIFLLGCLVFFMDKVIADAAINEMNVGAILIVGYVGLNFVFELLANILVSPTIVKLINIKKKS